MRTQTPGPPFPLLIKVWAGGEAHELRYIRTSLRSLVNSDLPKQARVFLVDDASPDPALAPLLRDLIDNDRQFEICRNEVRLGPNRGQEVHVPRLWQRFPDAPYLVCCDDDIIYAAGWLQALIATYEAARDDGLRGVFAALDVAAKPHYAQRQLRTGTVLLKRRQMALNWLIPHDVYEQVGPFRDTGVAFDTDYQARMQQHDLPVVCMKPSLVQNIGYHGFYQSDETMRAVDFVGRRSAWLVARDVLYAGRRALIDTAERIPDGNAKNALKIVAKPLRRWLSI